MNKNNLEHKGLLAILYIAVLPVALFFTVYCFAFSHTKVESIKDNLQTELQSLFEEYEKDISGTVSRVNDLAYNRDVQNTLLFTDYSDPETIPSIENTYSILSKIANTSALTDSIYIFNRKTNVVVGSNGKYDAGVFFSDIYNYADYDFDYWNSYKEPLSTISALPPSYCAMRGSSDAAYLSPVVFSSIGNLPSTSIIIMNINVDRFANNELTSGKNHNPNLFLLNKYTGTYLFPQNSVFGKDDDKFLAKVSEKITFNRTVSFNYTNERKYYVICASPVDSIWGYCYVSVIPYSDIYRDLYDDILWLIILFLSTMTGYVIVMIFIFRKLSPTFRTLANASKNPKYGDSSAGHGFFTYINENITHITSQNSELKERMSNILPIYYQRLLTNILNNNDNGQDLEAEFAKANFEYPNFISVAVRFYFSRRTSNPIYKEKADMIKLFEKALCEKYNAYSMPSNEDTLYAILNVDDSVSKDDIVNLINSVLDSFPDEECHIEIIYGIGNSYKGLEGLKESHKEAINNLLEVKQQKRIIIPGNKLSLMKNNIIDEPKLSNYLISGRYDAARSFIYDCTNDIYSMNPDSVQLYISVLNVIFNIILLKNIEFDNSENTAKLISDIIDKPKQEIDNYIDYLITLLEEGSQNYVSKLNITDVIEYIEKHFNEDLYLDMLAEKFDTNSKYLSRRIKQYIHIGFKDYLLKLRIDHAKKLLVETDMKIIDIAAECGIENRSTFIKAFKKTEGITPSEYRHNYKK